MHTVGRLLQVGRPVRTLAVIGVAALVAAGCGSGRTDDEGGGSSILVGTTDKVVTLDPAGAYDQGSYTPMNNVYSFVMNYAPGGTEPEPDAAEKCEFAEPKIYRCTLESGLKFANGNPLTAKSVKHSMDRILKINDANGPAALLGGLERTEATSDTVVDFHLKNANDQTFPQVLVTNAGPIADEKVFPADRLLDDDAIVKARPFSGAYTIESYKKNELIDYKANPDYQGILGKAQTERITVKYYASGENLKLETQEGRIDLGIRSFSPTDIDSFRKNDKLKVSEGPGGALRYMVFNMNTMPGGTPEQKLAVRKAIASSVDRQALADGVYKGTYSPAYSPVPSSFPGATDAFKIYGEKPNRDAASKFLADAGVPAPVAINLQYNPDHYGESSDEEYAAIKSQLESSGLFTVNLQATEWVTYQKERTKDAYPVFQLGWFPDFPDADTYLTPLFGPNNNLQNHFDNPAINELLVKETTEPDKNKRIEVLKQVQDELARNHIPMLPLLTGNEVAVSGTNIDGVDKTLDISFKIRYTTLTKK